MVKIRRIEKPRWIKEKRIRIELNLSVTFFDMEVTCLTTIRAKTR
jgi:hypothetical protein